MHSWLIRSLVVWILFSNKKGSVLFCSTLFPLDKNFSASALLTFEADNSLWLLDGGGCLGPCRVISRSLVSLDIRNLWQSKCLWTVRTTDLGRAVLNLATKMISFSAIFWFSSTKKKKTKQNYKSTNTQELISALFWVTFCNILIFSTKKKIYKLINTQKLLT